MVQQMCIDDDSDDVMIQLPIDDSDDDAITAVMVC
jgi:hypothetical protein